MKRIAKTADFPSRAMSDRQYRILVEAVTDYAIYMLDPNGPEPVTVDLSDFRKVGDVLVAFRCVVKAPDGKVLDDATVQTVEYLTLPASTFDPPGSAPH